MSVGNLQWAIETLRALTLSAEENRLDDYGGMRVYDAPVVGVADGDDELFERYRTLVSPLHLMPRELLAARAPEQVRVIVWALPFSAPVRESNRRGDEPSRLYSLARNNGGALNLLLGQRLCEAIGARGWVAVAPTLTEAYDAFRSPEHVFSSSWSERHVAFAAGLGQFGLSAALITSVGANVRIGSVITDMPLPVSPRASDHRAPCLASGGATCGKCIARCPVGAISAAGHDKALCYQMRQAVRSRHMEEYTREMKMISATLATSGRKQKGFSLGCALCQCGVPCENSIPGNCNA